MALLFAMGFGGREVFFIVGNAGRPLGDASLSSLVDARQCTPAERKSVDVCIVHAHSIVIAALFMAVDCCSYRTLDCFAFIVCFAFWFCALVIEGLCQQSALLIVQTFPQAFRERLDPKLSSRLREFWSLVCCREKTAEVHRISAVIILI